MDADTPRPVVDVESWNEMDELRKEVRRHRRRLAAGLLSLKFVWQRDPHPRKGQLWSPGIDVPGVFSSKPGWEPAGQLLTLATLSANANLAPDVCQVFLTWADEETYSVFRGDLREMGDLMQRFGRRRDWVENVSGVSSTLFTIFADELIWSDNEEPGQPATRSRVAELCDVYSHVENYLGLTLKLFVPTSSTGAGAKAKSVSQSGAPPDGDPDQLATTANEWWPDDGWHFREGQAAFRGVPFKIQGVPRRLLKKLAEAGKPVSDVALLAEIDPKGDAGQESLRTQLSRTRSILRKAFRMSSRSDPLPNVERGRDAAWKLDEKVFP
ncbi:hypothetical protein LBMAG52_39010 [Planctomycetia bacterium]|nr:hypothetical protein LBMAG52_39010 [Planctomycetia bacterium]